MIAPITHIPSFYHTGEMMLTKSTPTIRGEGVHVVT